MEIYNYYKESFSVLIDKKIVNIDPDDEQKELLSQIIAAEEERWDNPEYDVHALLHSSPKFEGGIGSYEYAELLEKWAEDKPDVKIFNFDDDMFMSSRGFIIPSKSKYQLMGFSVILCPQSGKPFEFFCYPNHLDSILKAFWAAEEDVIDLPSYDLSSPLFEKKQELKKKLLNSVICS